MTEQLYAIRHGKWFEGTPCCWSVCHCGWQSRFTSHELTVIQEWMQHYQDAHALGWGE